MADYPRFKVEFCGYFYGTEDAAEIFENLAAELRGSGKNEKIVMHGSYSGEGGQGGYNFTSLPEDSKEPADFVLAERLMDSDPLGL